MSEFLITRVKNSLNKQFYTMNDSWLSDCVEYYLNDHENPTQEEIITFVMNQYLLYDLREINNEKGCLPRNLAQQKFTTLNGRYILQMDKIYDISTSKYKQLEKIRNVSSENIEATENENVVQEEKLQNWEPKSKRMLQLFLTDGVQDILAIEYKQIRFLNDSLYPGFKLMIKGPVICRRGVLLLEEQNIKEVGGEVDSLLIVNAVENVFARALNLEENPDPYNDNNKQKQESQRPSQIEDDFIMDSDVLDQIDKQIEENSANVGQKSTGFNTNGQQRQNINTKQQENITSGINSQSRQDNNFLSNVNNRKQDNPNNLITPNSYTSIAKHETYTSGSNVNSHKSKTQTSGSNQSIQSRVSKFQDDDDLFMEMINEEAFENITTVKPASIKSNVNVQSSTSKVLQDSNESDFPMENEMFDLTEEKSTYFSNTKPQSKTSINFNFSSKPSTSKDDKKESTNSNSNKFNMQTNFPTPLNIEKMQFKNNVNEITDDFDFDDFDMKSVDYNDYFKESSTSNSNKASNALSTLKSNDSRKEALHIQTTSNKKSDTILNDANFEMDNEVDNLESEFNSEFSIEKTVYGCTENMTIKSKRQTNKKSTIESSGSKRLASERSPRPETPQKIRCLDTAKSSTSNTKKITDYFNKPPLLEENNLNVCEFLCDVLKQPIKLEGTRSIIRGRVIKLVRLSMLKNFDGYYFHLEGVITDGTAKLEVVFSSQVLEKVIGYTPHQFSLKRKESRKDPKIKELLKSDLAKAQYTLSCMDALMEIELKVGDKAAVLKISELSEEQKRHHNTKIQEYFDT